MGYEHGTVFIYQRELWLFEGYSTDVEMRQTLKLRGVGGKQKHALETECYLVLSPGEVDYEELEKGEQQS